MQEPVSPRELRGLLRRVVRIEQPPSRFSWIRVSVPAAALILIAVGILWWKHDPMEFATTPVAAVLESTEPREAVNWIRARTKFAMPDLRFPAEATVVMARQGEGGEWACLDFMCDGKMFFLYMKRSGESLGTTPTKLFNGNAFYEGQGVGWKTPNLAYYLKGGSREERWSFATHLAPQTRDET